MTMPRLTTQLLSLLLLAAPSLAQTVVIRAGHLFDARAGKIKLAEIGYELLSIAARGLERARSLNASGQDESIYLLRLMDLVRSGHSQASLVIARWKGEWNYDFTRLVKGCAYQAEAII